MKKIWESLRPYILVFSVHFIVSIVYNRANHLDEHIGETIVGSIMFTALYVALCLITRKRKG